MKSLKRKIQKLISDPIMIFNLLASKGLLNWLPDKIYLKILFYVRMRYRLNLDNPKSFNEKLQWLKLYDRDPAYTSMVDKYAVRHYIKEKIGEEYLIPLLGVWNSFDEIDFNKLPNQFVLKCTHDSGGVVICKNKNNFNIEIARKKINKSLKRNFYFHTREWPYKDIEPKIICEQYMVDESEKELKDYKFMCFNGQTKCLFVCKNRNSESGLNVDFYDMEWRPMPFERHYPNSGTSTPKPKTFNKMIELAEVLSKGIPFLRVDFYEVEGKIYFGELTFYPGSGYEEFTPKHYDYKLGSWLELPIEDGTENSKEF